MNYLEKKMCWALLCLLVSLPAASGAPAAGETRWEQSARKKQELTRDVVWTTHEPLIFLQRRGTHAEDQAEYFERQHDPENIRRMAEAGVRYGRLHFYKGFGLDAEREDIEKTRKAAELMHGYGMKVSLYVAGTMFIETFYQEVPEARNWEQRDQDDRPVPYSGVQTYRHYACPNEPAYRAYIKKVLKLGIEKIHPDQIFFDNIQLQPEPKSCRCARCLTAFHEFLRRKYPTPEAARRRFGFPAVDHLVVTQWDVYNGPGDVAVINDPVLQEWVRFRCETLARHNGELYDYVKSLDPKISVGFNLKGIYGLNRIWDKSIHHPLFAGRCDFSPFDMDGFEARIDPASGALISQIQSFKMARRLGINFEEDTTDDLDSALNMSFNYQRPVPGYGIQGGPARRGGSNVFTAFAEFFREYNDRYYVGIDNVADVAVLRNWPSMAYNIAATLVPTILMEQVLIQHKVPFDLLYDEQIERIDRYGAVILAGQECLSREHADRLLRYVRGGGTLVFSGNTADFNEWREVRAVHPFLSLMRAGAPAAFHVQPEGKGRIVYVPAFLRPGTPAERFRLPLPRPRTVAELQNIQLGTPGGQVAAGNPDIVTPPRGAARNFPPSQWTLPANHNEIYHAVVDHLPRGLSISSEAPLTTVMELLNRQETRETIVHFINFDRQHPLPPFPVVLAKQFAGKVKSVTRLAPDRDDPMPLEFEEASGRVRFTVPAMGIYSMIVVAHE